MPTMCPAHSRHFTKVTLALTASSHLFSLNVEWGNHAPPPRHTHTLVLSVPTERQLRAALSPHGRGPCSRRSRGVSASWRRPCRGAGGAGESRGTRRRVLPWDRSFRTQGRTRFPNIHACARTHTQTHVDTHGTGAGTWSIRPAQKAGGPHPPKQGGSAGWGPPSRCPLMWPRWKASPSLLRPASDRAASYGKSQPRQAPRSRSDVVTPSG